MASWSGFWGDGQGSNGSYDLLSGRNPLNYHTARLFRKRGLRMVSEVLTTLLGDATPSSTASVAISQVDAVRDLTANVQGGVRGITSNETVDAALLADKDGSTPNTARAVTAADVTALQGMLEGGSIEASRAPATYPTDASGNGGGSKLVGEV